MRATSIALASALLGAALAPTPASAGSVLKTLTQDAGNACTLSIPTTDTGVRPKATGFRNEGTANAFVICSADVANADGFGGDTTYIGLSLASFDGNAHSTNCTAVARYPDTLSNIQYVTLPALNTAATGVATSLTTSGAPPSYYDHQRGELSVTCVLPPGVSILAKSAVAAGADGVFLEFVHDPEKALCDGPSCLPLTDAKGLLTTLKAVHAAVRQ